MSIDNPYFNHDGRAPYDLGFLMRRLPDSFQADHAMTTDERQQVDAANRFAGNATMTLVDGMESLGELLFLASGNEEYPLESRHLANIGNLIKHMAVETQFLIEQQGNLQSNLDQDAKRTAAAGPAKKGGAK